MTCVDDHRGRTGRSDWVRASVPGDPPPWHVDAGHAPGGERPGGVLDQSVGHWSAAPSFPPGGRCPDPPSSEVCCVLLPCRHRARGGARARPVADSARHPRCAPPVVAGLGVRGRPGLASPGSSPGSCHPWRHRATGVDPVAAAPRGRRCRQWAPRAGRLLSSTGWTRRHVNRDALRERCVADQADDGGHGCDRGDRGGDQSASSSWLLPSVGLDAGSETRTTARSAIS